MITENDEPGGDQDENNLPEHQSRNEELESVIDLPEDIEDDIQSLPPDGQRRVVRYIKQTIESHKGPLPHPETLREYNEIIPNGAERIMQMAEKEGDHRRKIHSTVIKQSFRLKFLGQVFGFLIALITMGIGGWSIHEGNEISGAIFGIGGVASLAAVFVTGRLHRRNEDDDDE